MMSWAQAQRSRHIAVKRLESAHVPNLTTSDLAQKPVGDAARNTLGKKRFLAPGAIAGNQCEAFLQLVVEDDDVLGLVLQITVGDDDHTTTGMLDSRVKRAALPDVAREQNRPQRRISRGALTQEAIGGVG